MRLELLEHGPHASIADVVQASINADPNYGALWLYCKRDALNSIRQVLRNARRALLAELHPGAEVQKSREPTDQGCTEMPDRALTVKAVYHDVRNRAQQQQYQAIFL